MSRMRILTWNINGIRAGRERTGIKQLLDLLNADVICLQETKVTRDMLDEPTAIVDGFDSYFAFSRKRSGYSGTANYCRCAAAPEKAEEGLTGRLSTPSDSIIGCYGDPVPHTDADLDAIDAEGRCIITQHKIRLGAAGLQSVAIINVYVPRSGCREDRHEYKIKFLSNLQSRAEAILKTGVHVIILGDLNLTHKRLDNCDPESDDDFKRSTSRIWLNNMLQKTEQDPGIPKTDGVLAELAIHDLEGGHFSDVYRRLHPNKKDAFTNWNTATDARKANYGRRLDHILVDTQLAKNTQSCEILAHVEGSDHCPVLLELDCQAESHQVTPALCSKLMPEFKGKQQKLSSFFSKCGSQDVHKTADIADYASKGKSNSNSDSASLKKSLSVPNSPSSKLSSKRASAESFDRVSNAKKSKLKKKDSNCSNQISLTSFFTSSNPVNTGTTNNKTNLNSHKTESRLEIQEEQTRVQRPQEKDEVNNGSLFTTTTEDLTPQTNTPQIVSQISGYLHSTLAPSPGQCGAEREHKTQSLSGQCEALPTKASSTQAWKSLLKGLPPPPLCPGHKEPCLLKTVKKAGPNKNKQFYTCPRPDGAPGNPEFRCNFFQWLDDRLKKKKT